MDRTRPTGRLGSLIALGMLGAASLLLAGCVTGPAPETPSDAPTSGTEAPAPALGDVASAAVERFGASACPEELASSLYVPSLEGYVCGAIEVPLDPEEPSGESLWLDVIIADSGLSREESRGTVLYIGGGPGGVSRWSAAIAPYVMADIRGQFDIVAMDLRGTGADALSCPMLQDAVGTSDVAAPSAEAVAECAEILGDRALHQSTADAIADLEVLREALGVDRWILDGTSYGTFTAQQYALRHPEAVRALVLDGLVPTEGADPFLLSSMQSTARVLTELCESDACGFDPAAAIESITAAGYPALPLLNAIIGQSAMGGAFTGLLAALEAATAGDLAPLDAVIAEVEGLSSADLESFSAGAHIATLCSDTPMPWGDATTAVADRAPAIAAAVAALTPEATWPYPTSVAGEVGPIVSCSLWPVEAFDAPLSGPLPEVPTLVMSGGWDLSTPVSNAEGFLEANPGAESAVFPGRGHAVQNDPEALAVLAEFLFALD